jgi:adenylate cyclase
MSEKARLIVTTDKQGEFSIELSTVVTIGRSNSSDVFVDDPDASRRHAEIRRRGNNYILSDLGSVNGTWLNNRRVTVPRDLEDGDQIRIGNGTIRYVAAPGDVELDSTVGQSTTRRLISNGHVVVLVADIRNYTAMSEKIPSREMSRLLSDWFKKASDIIETRNGIIDKFIGDAIMACWVVAESDAPTQVNQALAASRELLACAGAFSNEVTAQFPDHKFRIGIGLNIGEAMFGNVGTDTNQSFTVVGDCVNVAFRLEALTKEKGTPVIVSNGIVESANGDYQFDDLGEAVVKGRKEPVSIWALNL